MLEKDDKDYVLVISWGGSKGLFACGILKALEELGMKEQISAIFGISSGALLGAYRASGWTAEQIYARFLEIDFFSFKNIALPPKKSLLKNDFIAQTLKTDLRKKFNKLDIPLYVWATDLLKGKLKIFSKGEVIPPLLWSIALPAIFPPVEYKNHLLVDGGVVNNFPIHEAKKQYPNTKIIWVLLNKFQEDQKIDSLIDNLLVSYGLLLKKNIAEESKLVDYLFDEILKVGTLETNQAKITKIYQLGYKKGLAAFTAFV